MLFGLVRTAKEIENDYKRFVDGAIQDPNYKKGAKK